MHKLLFDQNLSHQIIQKLEHLFPESNHVKLLDLDTEDDLSVWHYAKKNNFHLVSKDTDFINLNVIYGYPPKIIMIRTGNTTTKTIIELFKRKSDSIYAFLDDENAGLLELS
jgi:predicted nuclease of predicted toxin-antitoxin system